MTAPRSAETDLLAELRPLAAVIAGKVHTTPVAFGPGGTDHLVAELTVAVAVYCARHVLPPDWLNRVTDEARQEGTSS